MQPFKSQILKIIEKKEDLANQENIDLPFYSAAVIIFEKLKKGGVPVDLAAKIVGRMEINIAPNLSDENKLLLDRLIDAEAIMITKLYFKIQSDFGNLTEEVILPMVEKSLGFDFNPL